MKCLWCWIFCFYFLMSAAALEASDHEIGTVKKVNGTVSITRHKKTIKALTGLKLHKNDRVETGKNGSIGVTFKDNSLLSLGPNSNLVIDEFIFTPNQGKYSFVVKMIRGTAVYLSGLITKLSPEAVKFETPNASLGVRGTKFAVKVEEYHEEYRDIMVEEYLGNYFR